MFKYTQIIDGDRVVEDDINKMIKAVGNAKVEVWLFGSYSKGEGGIINGKAVNDYDILLIGGDEKVKKDIENADTTVKPEVHQYKDLKNIECNQQWWEIKYSAINIVGDKKELDLPDWQPYDIPFSDAINSLNKRVLSMLVGKYEMMKESPDYNKVISQIGKMIIAIGDAILIKRGQFNPSYRTRMLMLINDEIYPLYSLAVSHKIFGLPELNPDEIWNLWNNVKEYFRQYIINNQIHTDFGEMLINFDERIELDKLKSLLQALGVNDNYL